MKKYFGYMILIFVGVVALVSMMYRSEALDNNVSNNDTYEIFI